MIICSCLPTRVRFYRIRCYDIPQDLTRTTKGTAIANVLAIDPKEQVTALVVAKDTATGLYMIMSHPEALLRKTSMDKFAVVRASGLIAMN